MSFCDIVCGAISPASFENSVQKTCTHLHINRKTEASRLLSTVLDCNKPASCRNMCQNVTVGTNWNDLVNVFCGDPFLKKEEYNMVKQACVSTPFRQKFSKICDAVQFIRDDQQACLRYAAIAKDVYMNQ